MKEESYSVLRGDTTNGTNSFSKRFFWVIFGIDNNYGYLKLLVGQNRSRSQTSTSRSPTSNHSGDQQAGGKYSIFGMNAPEDQI